MSELRWNPLLGTFTIVAANRQSRPDRPKEYCPFCPGEGKKIPEYQVLAYPNDFPALDLVSTHSDEKGFFQSQNAEGVCEVILYSPDHKATLHQQTEGHLYKLVSLWAERTQQISQDRRIRYVFIFENRGEEVGVTMPHPHGQLYGYSWVPLKIETELKNARLHYEQTGRNLLLELVKEEQNDGRRIVFENEFFVAYIPYFTDYPYGVFISSKLQRSHITDFSHEERFALGGILKNVCGGMDELFNKPFPYMMCMHQAPHNTPEYADAAHYYSFHIEFYPPLRSADSLKWYASSEMGAWAATNTRAVEETAQELKMAIQKYIHNSYLFV